MILTYPDVYPDAATFGLVSTTQNMRSELNGAVQTVALPGDKWQGTLTYSNRQGAEAQALRAFLASCRGSSGRFTITPPDYYGLYSRGLNLSSVWASGGSITTSLPLLLADNTFITVDSTITGDSSVYWLMAGDYFEILGELKMVTSSVPDTGAGTCAVSFVPPLRQAVPSGTTIKVVDPKCTCMLTDDNQAQWQIQSGMLYALSVSFEEALV